LYNKVRSSAVSAEADGSQLGVSGQTAGETPRRSAGQFNPVPFGVNCSFSPTELEVGR
jgi:hypothetical protein